VRKLADDDAPRCSSRRGCHLSQTRVPWAIQVDGAVEAGFAVGKLSRLPLPFLLPNHLLHGKLPFTRPRSHVPESTGTMISPLIEAGNTARYLKG